MGFFIGLVVVDFAFEGCDKVEDDEIEKGKCDGDFDAVGGDGDADGAGVPYAGGGGGADDHVVAAFFEDGAAADETDAGDDAVDNTRLCLLVVKNTGADKHECACAECDEGEGAESCCASALLAVPGYGHGEYKGDGEMDKVVDDYFPVDVWKHRWFLLFLTIFFPVKNVFEFWFRRLCRVGVGGFSDGEEDVETMVVGDGE